MAKKCIPGVFCIENMTLFILLFIFLLSLFFFFTITNRIGGPSEPLLRTQPVNELPVFGTSRRDIPIIGLGKSDVFSDPYFPPLKDNIESGIFYTGPPAFGIGNFPTRRGLPINIETQPTGSYFNQIGILTRSGNINGELILPIFGRNLFSNRDKWQYYTLSNTGNISSKLPVRVHGKDGMSEYGVDELTNGDVVYVQGYNDIFLATVYDSRGLSYIPYL